MDQQALIELIEAAAKRHSLAPATITSRAVSNSRLYDRLQNGGDCTTTIAKKICDFVDELDAEAEKKSEAAA